jgi:DNA-directed RNA polymerase III subunit RPC1
MLKEKLDQHKTSSDGGCTEEFKECLTKFLEKRIQLLNCTRKALHLDEKHVGKNDSCIEETIAANISGISAKQLQVCAYDLIHVPYYQIYGSMTAVIFNQTSAIFFN